MASCILYFIVFFYLRKFPNERTSVRVKCLSWFAQKFSRFSTESPIPRCSSVLGKSAQLVTLGPLFLFPKRFSIISYTRTVFNQHLQNGNRFSWLQSKFIYQVRHRTKANVFVSCGRKATRWIDVGPRKSNKIKRESKSYVQ